ncbi:cytochrome c biogenesis heme-transporting ATPase CcmA [Marinomonas sp. C2222]|uniref:Cytochrome c biogenesis heme-transporting ATPase CcmA n=1 Tax=Marinomonas sargassi TaxID=2984494 RepID=A0ABT2YN99_9GAMM|nr:cytochrome c biogenesis heme-transporting ATPase CcmA [Marinomonas sargassi]MCV2401365.1 cytochrome c biogenesis heme-transporting ATPase CcmA [Marinomonas sargassi]
MQSADFLTITDLWIERGERVLCKELSFSVQSGEVIRILGENGAGKSSLLKALLGTVLIDEGSILYLGEDITADRSNLHKDTLYIGHSVGLKKALTVRENLALYCPDVSIEGYQPILEELGLAPFLDMPVNKLSQGQARRTALSRLWLTQKSLWILDEPFSALDDQACLLLEKKIEQHSLAGGVVLLTTHIPLSSIQPRELEFAV